MKRSIGKRARIGGGLLAVALAALALALPAIGLSKQGGDRGPRAAGTVQSFDPETGELVVDLAKGETISGLVVRRTRIRCGEGRKHHPRWRRHRRRHGASASRRGEGIVGSDREAGNQPTDVRGDRGVGPGEDHGEQNGEGTHDQRRDDRCNVDDLVPGAVVMRAEIVLTHGKAIYAKIGLLPQQHETSTE
jgi:hypothetical protein